MCVRGWEEKWYCRLHSFSNKLRMYTMRDKVKGFKLMHRFFLKAIFVSESF